MINRDQQSQRAAQKIGFLGVIDLADIFEKRAALDHRADHFVIIVLIGAINFAAILSGMPHRAATLMARSTPFSGAIRPSTARYPGLTGCGVSKFSGKPWWIVRIQFP